MVLEYLSTFGSLIRGECWDSYSIDRASGNVNESDSLFVQQKRSVPRDSSKIIQILEKELYDVPWLGDLGFPNVD